MPAAPGTKAQGGNSWIPPDVMANGNTEPDQATARIHAESTGFRSDAIMELLIDQLRELLHAEKQLTKALPKLAKAARAAQLKRLFEFHLQETEGQGGAT